MLVVLHERQHTHTHTHTHTHPESPFNCSGELSYFTCSNTWSEVENLHIMLPSNRRLHSPRGCLFASGVTHVTELASKHARARAPHTTQRSSAEWQTQQGGQEGKVDEWEGDLLVLAVGNAQQAGQVMVMSLPTQTCIYDRVRPFLIVLIPSFCLFP